MRMMLFAVPVAFSLACGADQPPVRVETPSPTSGATAIQAPDPPFTIEGPLAVEEAGAALETASAWEARVVVDKELQSVWIVSPTLLDAATQRHASLQLAWIDDATLAIASEGKTYAWQVGGPIEPRQLFLPTATPRTSTSVDNSWYARSGTADTHHDTFIGRTGAEPSFKLLNASCCSWSPTDPTRAALLGNTCVFPDGLYDVMLFDANDGTLRNLTANLPDGVVMFLANFLWHPDGNRIAIETWGKSGARSRLLLVDVNTGMADSVALTEHLAPVPLAWSPGGSYLLVRFEGAHGGLFCEQQPVWAPSTVERLRP